MTLVQTNRASFTSAEAITSATQTTITRTSATDGLPGDSNGPASGEYAVVFTDGTNFEIAYVTGGQGTPTLTLQRAAELIGGTQTALSSVASGTTFYAVATAASISSGPSIASYDTTVLTKLSLAPVSYYKCNEAVGASSIIDYGTAAVDAVVHGTMTFGTAALVPTDSETSVTGDGSTGYATPASYPASYPVGRDPFTIIWVMKYNGTTASANDIFLGTTSNNEGLGILTGYGGTAALEIAVYGSTLALYSSFAGEAHLFGVFYDGTNLGMMLDGNQITPSGNPAFSSLNITAGVFDIIGGPNGYTNYPTGRYALFNGLLTPKDWALLMQAFTGV